MTFVRAAHYGLGRAEPPSVVIVHTTETDQKAGAEAIVAAFFHNQPADTANPTSAHGVVGANSLIRCVLDGDTAYQCGTHGNRIGLGLEHIGHAAMTVAQWDTPYTTAMLTLSAGQIAEWCRTYSIPVVKLTPADLLAGKRGICGHIDITHAWPADTTHTDPGTSWPWAQHLELIQRALHPTPAPVPVPQPRSKESDVWAFRAGGPGAKSYILAEGLLLAVSDAEALDVRTQGGVYSEVTPATFTKISAKYPPA